MTDSSTEPDQSTPDEDVMIEFNPQAEETVSVSMDDLKADGYEPPADDTATA